MSANSHTFPTFQQAREEAERCLYCFDAPCTKACPAHIDVPTFISMIKSGNLLGASEIVKTSNALANVCGKVCPEEIYCQSVCNRSSLEGPILIRELHLFATRHEARSGYRTISSSQKSGLKVAVVGGGPAGLGCTFELARRGHAVTLFDRSRPGGVPKNSIPAFRLSHDDLMDDMDFLSSHFRWERANVTAANFHQLKKKFGAVFIAVGLGQDRSLGLKGDDRKGVVPVIRFLETAKRGRASVGKRVVVIGGGNVSLDAAATAKRLGAREVILIYRRSENEMKVWRTELDEARKRGVEIRFLTTPIEIIGKGRVSGVRCARTKLSRTKDASGRAIPVEVKDSEFVIDVDTVIVAIGQVIGSDLVKMFRLNRRGLIAVDKKFRTSVSGVFAGGDAISGEGTIVQSVAHGRQAAMAMDAYLQQRMKRATP